MNYKKLIPDLNTRIKILNFFDFIPDKWMIKLQYRISTGRRLNLKNPKRYTEKLQWYKLHYRDPLMTQCADKFGVREFVKSKGLENILVPLYGVYDDAKDIDFEEYPLKFVLKTTNGSHTNILCENKNELDFEQTRNTLNGWLNKKRGKLGREWAYYDIKPRIIAEKFLENDKNNDMVDYKFFCFNGEPYCLYVISDRFSKTGEKLSILDINFNPLPYKRDDVVEHEKVPIKPENYDMMVEIVRKLSKDFPHVRVDLYNMDGKIYFGELTFYSGGGYKDYEPDKFDYILGEQFKTKNIN